MPLATGDREGTLPPVADGGQDEEHPEEHDEEHYAPSPVPWVAEEVAQLEATGTAFGGRAVVLLTHRGVKTGLVRKTPLMRVELRGVYAAVASTRGGPDHPHWYANVLASPDVQLRDGDLRLDLRAREVTGTERSRWWSLACGTFPSYVEYQRRTRRRIPVLLLEPRPAPDPLAPTEP